MLPGALTGLGATTWTHVGASLASGSTWLDGIVRDWFGAEPGTWSYGLAFAIGSLAICFVLFIGFISLVGLIGIYFERKISAWMQSRRGPLHVGPKGLFQTTADGLKLLAKEDLIPGQADRFLFVIAPAFVFGSAVALMVTIPFADGWVMADLNVGVVYISAIASVGVVGVLLAGWGSNNKWSLFGAMREAAQMVSYEIPLGLMMLMVCAYAGSLSLSEIASAQQTGWAFAPDGGSALGILSWNLFKSPFMFLGFFVFYTAILASTKRSPFDLPEGESELVAGFLTEYSGMRWSIFFLAEYAEMYALSAVGVALFLGGWDSGIPGLQSVINGLGAGGGFGAFVMHLIHVSIFVGKSALLILLMMWLRWTLPRVRLDQVMYVCLKVLLPFSLFFLVGNAAWTLLF